MSNDHEANLPTRRDCVKRGGAFVCGGLLAGCSGDGGTGTPDPSETFADEDARLFDYQRVADAVAGRHEE